MPSGFLLINKPEEWTSHDVVGYLRKVTKIKKIGHAGTLDPFATGLLIVAIERAATKKIDTFKNLPKTYLTTIKLGAETNTYDKTGQITKTSDLPAPSLDQIKKTLATFTGKQQQIPPMFSAKKVKGQKLYELARQGIEIERQPSEIEIYNIELIEYNYPNLTIRVDCGTGTYIRSLAHDIGAKLGVGGHCDSLYREKIGVYSAKNAYKPEDIHMPIEKFLLSTE